MLTIRVITGVLAFYLNIVPGMGTVLAAEVEDNRSTEIKRVSVQTEVVRYEQVSDRMEAIGTLRPNESIVITVGISENVTAVRFSGGQRVKKGDVLLEMASEEEVAMRQEVKFTVDEAFRQLERIQTIAQRGDASQSLLDQKRREYNVARARLMAIDSRLKDHQIRVPFDGVVGLRNISEGAYLVPSDIVTTLIDDSQMKLDFSVPSLFINTLQPGMPIIATSRAYPLQAFHGVVNAIDNQVDPITRAITVRAIIPNAGGMLKPGVLMEVELLSNLRQSMVVAEEAIVPLGTNHFVFIAHKNNGEYIARKRQVQLGNRWLGKVEVLQGLSEGEHVITRGKMRLKSDAPIQIIGNDAPEVSVRKEPVVLQPLGES